jgi:alpha-L-arabinofuranosidase
VYAVRTPNGKGRIMVVNKMRSTAVDAEIRLQGLRASSQVTVRFYSAAQDSTRSESLGVRTISSRGDRITYRFPPMSVSVLEW